MRADLETFRAQHEAFVGLVSDALSYGPCPGLDQAYRRQRAQMQREYEGVRAVLAPYLDGTEDGSHLGNRTADALEKLMEPPTLVQVLQGDPGRILARIAYTREAIALCAGHEVPAVAGA